MGIRIGSIDVGSNAIRMSIGEIINRNEVELIHSERVSIRLGQDSFSKGFIGDETLKLLLKSFVDFQKVFIKHKVKYYKAVATSALRDSKNKEELVDLVFSTSHIQLDIIDGQEEARLVHLGVSHVEDISEKRALIIDIGGGSVEFIISNRGKIVKFFSYNLGTVRLLQKMKNISSVDLKNYLQSEIRKSFRSLWRYRRFFDVEFSKKVFIGTGGNIKALNKLSNTLFKNTNTKVISLFELELLEKILSGYSVQDRIEKLMLREDRADVILPALFIVSEVLKIMNFKEIKAPDVGLKDGILIQVAKDQK